MTGGGQIGTIAPGNQLFLDLNGTVRRYDLRTGTLSWQRSSEAATSSTYPDDAEATQGLVMVSAGPQKYTFLDAATGQTLGAMNQTAPGRPLLVGAHVVISEGDQLEGYDPRTAKTTWQDTVPPSSDTVHDDATIYLNPAPGSAGAVSIGRIDAATGRRLAPLEISPAARLNPASSNTGSVGQGLLVLEDASGEAPSSAPGQPIGQGSIVRSVAVNSSTGATVWMRAGDTGATDAGPFFRAGGPSESYTAVDPRTGQNLWSVSESGLGNDGGQYPLIAVPDYLVQAAYANVSDDSGSVAGVPPEGPGATPPAWHSAPLVRVQFVAADQDTAVVSTCDPWGDSARPTVCASRALIAITI
jgi:hypothetical protein